jgi:hypothetical protein
MSEQQLTLTQAVRDGLANVPKKAVGTDTITFILPAKNGGRGTVEILVKNERRGRWQSEYREYDLKFLLVSVSLREKFRGEYDIDMSFGLCPFDDGKKIARKVSAIEVLEHVEPEQIRDKLASMAARMGDLNF